MMMNLITPKSASKIVVFVCLFSMIIGYEEVTMWKWRVFDCLGLDLRTTSPGLVFPASLFPLYKTDFIFA